MSCFVLVLCNCRTKSSILQTCEALHIVLYHYAGNNPVRYIDPDGRKVKNKETQQLLDKVFENRLPKILTEDFLKKINDNSIQGRRFTKIFDLSYIGDNSELQKQAVKILKDAQNQTMKVLILMFGLMEIYVLK